jgi:hypothetical protein
VSNYQSQNERDDLGILNDTESDCLVGICDLSHSGWVAEIKIPISRRRRPNKSSK